MGMLKIEKAGLSSTIQDLGRYGYQSKGVSVSGAMDQLAMKLANILVGNPQNTACIEMTMKGDRITFSKDTTIAICGADFDFEINGKSINTNESIPILSGDELTSGYGKGGMRAYLSIKGGLKIDEVLGSKSTSVREKLGGHLGRALKNGDCLSYVSSNAYLKQRRVPDEITNLIYKQRAVRFIYSAEMERFTEEGVKIFETETYSVTNHSNRMGYRLEGPTIETKSGSDMISGAVNFGSIQVPGSGQPIVMMADRQTVGGYVKIGQVIQTDLPYLSQKMPGMKVTFENVTVEEAILTWKQVHIMIEDWASGLDYKLIDGHSKHYDIKVGKSFYKVRVSEIE